MLNISNNLKSGFNAWKKYRMATNSRLLHTPKPSNLDIEINRIVWIDMEMTGLNIEIDKILEIACLVTDSDLNIIAEAPELIINQPANILKNMDEWCIKQHGKTGLIEDSKNSSHTINEAEHTILNFLSEHVTEKTSPLAGNSVYMDRVFLRKFLPKVDAYLHYRIIDVSSIKEVCRRWNNKLYRTAPEKNYTHRALNDIRESVNELKFYKTHFFQT